MKTIKIFLASSEELADERIKFGDFIRKLDDTYEIRGYRIKLYKWEDLPSGDNGRPKQEEYDDKVRECDMFVGLFHTKANPFTLEEYDIAKKTQLAKGKPTLYVFCRELTPGEKEEPALTDFKNRLLKSIKHYWNNYTNSDSLQLQFVMQLMIIENNRWNELKIENGNVFLGRMEIAKMDNLRFAAENEDYVKTQAEIFELDDEIKEMQQKIEKKQQKLEKKKSKLENNPDDQDCLEEYQEAKEDLDDLVDRLQRKIEKYNELKEDFEQFQKILLDTAKRVVRLQGERVTENLQRAMDAFNEGKVREANFILDQIVANADGEFDDYKQSKEITELKRQNIINSIEVFQLRANTILADVSIPIEERVAQAEQNYAKADERAQAVDYDQEDYLALLFEYGTFLSRYGFVEESLDLFQKMLVLSNEVYGEEDSLTAMIYGSISQNCCVIGKYSEALESANKALEIVEKLECDSIVLLVYGIIINVFSGLTKLEEARACCEKLLEINENIGLEPELLGVVYTNMGRYYHDKGELEKALGCFQKLLEIEVDDVAFDILACKALGQIYRDLGNTDEAMRLLRKAVALTEKELGAKSFYIVDLYLDIAGLFSGKEAMEYGLKALEIYKEGLDTENVLMARINNTIGNANFDLGEYTEALNYYLQSLRIYNRLEIDSSQTAIVSFNVGEAYFGLEEYEEALKYYKKALAIHKRLGIENTGTAQFNENISYVYIKLGQFLEAIEYHKTAMAIHQRLGDDSDGIG